MGVVNALPQEVCPCTVGALLLEAFGGADHAAERGRLAARCGARTASSITEQDISGLIIATQEDRVSVSAGDTVILDQGRYKASKWAIAMQCSRAVVPASIRLPGVSFGCRVT